MATSPAMEKNAAVLVLPGDEDIRVLMQGDVDIEWMKTTGEGHQKVNKFVEKKPPQLREPGLALPTLFLHTLDKKFMCNEGESDREPSELDLNMRSGNDNSELVLVFPEECVRHGQDSEAKEAWNTVVAFLRGQGEVMASESKTEGGKVKARFNRHRLNFKLKTSRPKAGISLPKKLFGIPEAAEVYLFAENHASVGFMTEKDTAAIDECIMAFSNATDKNKLALATFLKVFFEGGFAYNAKKPISGGYIPINASIACLGVTPSFEGQLGIGTGWPYHLKATHMPFVDTVPVTIGGIRDMSDRHKRYGLCFTRCVHVWEGESYARTGELDYCAILPHGGFYYVPETLGQYATLGGLVYAFGESTDAAEAGNEDGAAAAAVAAPSLNMIQVCFVMDCTGSMGNWIEEAKKSVISMADGITAEAEGTTVEMGFVCYRDYDSGADNIVPKEFTTNVSSIKDFIGTLRAKGGDDAPEDMAGGLEAAMKLKWQAGAKKKFLVIVADAPCHGSQFHSLSDRHPDGGRSGMPNAHLAKMKQDKIQLIFTKINSTTDKMVTEFRKIYEGDGMKMTVTDLSTGGTAAFKKAILAEVVANLG